MHRTEGAHNVGNLFVDGPPGTTVEEDFLNAVQEEIAYSIEQAGITLKTATTETRTQLKAGIDALADTRIAATDLRRKNALINGSMDHAQRGASGAATFTGVAAEDEPINDDDTYLFDRWILLSDGNDIVDVSQDTDVPTAPGALLSCKLDVETINKKFGIFQPIEQKNCQRMIGGTASLSFKAKVSDVTKLDNIKAVVLAWDGAADVVTSDIVAAWNAEDTAPTWAGSWTAENTPANLGVTNAWAEYSIPAISIDTAAAKNIGVFIWSDVTDTTAGHFLYITDVQLELGNVVTPFEYMLVGDELALCQRYYCKSYDQGTAPGANVVNGRCQWSCSDLTNSDSTVQLNVVHPAVMRAVPTIVTWDLLEAIGKVQVCGLDGIVPALVAEGESRVSVSAVRGAGQTSKTLKFQYTAESEL